MPTFAHRGARLHARDSGPVSTPGPGVGPPVLFLHAYPLSGEMWRAQEDALAGRARTLTLDFPGFGGSEPRPLSGIEDLADAALALLDHLGIDRAVVCSLSMGGYAALALADRAPERIAALVLADTRATADTEAARQGRLAAAERVLAEGTGFLVEELPAKLAAPASLAREPFASWLRAQIRDARPEGIAWALRAMAARPDRTAILTRLVMPTLVVVGELDTLTPPSDAEALSRDIPGARLTVIPGVGHLSNLEAPDSFTERLIDFLSAL